MDIILIIDWLDKYGGAERVISSISKTFNVKSCHTLVNRMSKNDLKKTFPDYEVHVEETKLKYFKGNFRYFIFLFSFFIRKIKIPKETNVILSSSHAVAKGVKKSHKNQLHISYFQARNLKYIWSELGLYLGKFKFLAFPVIYFLRKLDIRDSKQPDYIISNSIFVKNWVKKVYNRDSIVIYPPVDLSNFSLQLEKEEYYVAVGRIEPYKRFDVIIDAFNKTDKNLIVVGDGSQLAELKSKANKNISFVGYLESHEVNKYISKAKGFIHAGIEDFGIAPIEAQSCGTPVIAYGFGGVLETIIENKTGVFFYEQDGLTLLNTIINFEKLKLDYNEIRANALKFSKERFENEIKLFVNEKYDKLYNSN